MVWARPAALSSNDRGSSVDANVGWFRMSTISAKLAELLSQETKFRAVVARLILDENPLTGGDREDVDKDITGVTALFDTLKTSSVTELGLAKCRLGPRKKCNRNLRVLIIERKASLSIHLSSSHRGS
eukprot:COSAG02_NODE_1711_length_11223_cov_5.622348_12_plen_128_part_00